MTGWKYAQQLLAIIVCLPMLTMAQPIGSAGVQTGPYSTVPAEPLPEQINLLQAIVTLDFPRREVQTVGDALRHLLASTGYRLASTDASDPAMQTLLRQSLPAVHRQLGPCTLQDALTTLASPVYRLVVDRPHRLVSFELTAKYRTLVQASYTAQAREAPGHGALRR